MKSKNRCSRLAWLLSVLLIVLCVAGGLWFFLLRVTDLHLKQREDAERAALIASAQIASHGRIPYDWDAAVRLSPTALNSAAAILAGTELEVPKAHNLPSDLQIKVVSVKVTSESGFASATVRLQADVPSSNITLSLLCDGMLRYLGEAPAPRPGWSSLLFGIDLVSVEPSLESQWFNFALRRFAGQFLASGIMAALGKNCQFAVPLPASIGTDCPAASQSESVKAGEATVPVAFQFPAIKVYSPVHFAGPVFTNDGVWLLANRTVPAIPVITESDKSKLQEIVRAALKEAPAPDHDSNALAWVKGDVLTELLRAAVPEKIDLTATVGQPQGHLYHEKWQFMGSGELKVDMKVPSDPPRLALRDMKAAWSENGLHASITATPSATVPIKIHLDPGPTGGEGFDVGMQCTGGPYALAAQIQPKVVKVDEKCVLVLGAAGEPVPLTATIETDGRFKCSVGSAKVAKVGVALSGLLNPSGLPPVYLFSECPHFVPVRPRGLTFPNAGIEVAFAPRRAQCLSAGLILHGSLSLAAGDGKNLPDETSVRKAVQTTAEDAKAVTGVEAAVRVAGLEVGPNNAVLRLLGNAVNDLTKGPGPNNEFVAAANSAARELLGAEIKVQNWIPGPERILASTKEQAEKLAGKAGKELESALHDVGKAATTAVDAGKGLIKKGKDEFKKKTGIRLP